MGMEFKMEVHVYIYIYIGNDYSEIVL